MGDAVLAPGHSRQLLTPLTAISLTLSAAHDPASYYRTRSGLYVWESFVSDVVANAKPMMAGATFTVNVAELKSDATDAEIEAALPKTHLFDDSAVCAIVAEMIEKQPEGKSGDLDNTGRANLFYTAGRIARVYWHGVDRQWDMRAWHRGLGWDAGARVLCPGS